MEIQILHPQNEGKQCKYCGATFARLHKTEPVTNPNPMTGKKSASLFVRVFRVFGCISLACLMIVPHSYCCGYGFAAADRNPPRRCAKAEAKVQSFQASMREGRPDTLQTGERQPELNGWLGANLVLNQPRGSESSRPPDLASAIDPARKADEPLNNAELQQAESSVHDVKAELDEDTVKAYVL